MKKIWFVFVCLAGPALVAHSPSSHREEGPHEHGVLQLDIAVDGKTADIDLESPAVNIYGFEHEARSAEDRARQKAGLDRIRNNLASLIRLDPGLGCRFKVEKLEWVLEKEAGNNPGEKEGQHSVVQGEFKVTCARPLAGSKVAFAFTRFFKEFNLTRIKVQAISGEKQRSTDIVNDEGTVEL